MKMHDKGSKKGEEGVNGEDCDWQQRESIRDITIFRRQSEPWLAEQLKRDTPGWEGWVG